MLIDISVVSLDPALWALEDKHVKYILHCAVHFCHWFFTGALLALPHAFLSLQLLLARVAVDTVTLRTFLGLPNNEVADTAEEVVDHISQLSWYEVR